MARLSKEENLQLVSAADAMLAEIGLIEVIEKYNPRESISPTKYFNFAWKYWIKHMKREVKRKKFRKKHRDYLDSPEWKLKRDARMDFDNGICVDCGKHAQCVHHRHYQTWKHEDIYTDLVSLCHDCHYIRHFGNS